LAVYDQPAIVEFATLESEWKLVGISFNETRRANRSVARIERCANSSDRLNNSGTISPAGLRAFNERGRSSATYQSKEWSEHLSVVA
jgi:hypothetical protein